MDYSVCVEVFECRYYLCDVALDLYFCESFSAFDEFIKSLRIQNM